MTNYNTSIIKTFSIIESFSSSGKNELTLSEISNLTNIPLSTVYRMVSTLCSLGYLYKSNYTKEYHLGWKIAQIAECMDRSIEMMLKEISHPYVDQLSKKYNENASIYTQIDKKRICIVRVEGSQEIRNIVKIGYVSDIHLGSPGKIILAFLPENTWSYYVPQVDDAYYDMLKEIRKNGFAATEAERTAGVSSISAPIFDAQNNIIGALTLSGPTFRFKDNKYPEKIESVKEYAALITEEAVKRTKQYNHLLRTEHI